MGQKMEMKTTLGRWIAAEETLVQEALEQQSMAAITLISRCVLFRNTVKPKKIQFGEVMKRMIKVTRSSTIVCFHCSCHVNHN